MSLETVLEENNALLREQTAVMRALLERLGAGTLPAAAPEPAAAPVAAAPAATKTVATPPPPAPSPAPAAAAVTYDDIKPLIVKLAAKNRAAATELLGAFGVTRGPDLKAEQYPEVLAKLQAALA